MSNTSSRRSAITYLVSLIAAIAVSLASTALWAQTTYVWNTAGSGDWDTGSWTPAGPADGAGNTADFSTKDISSFADVSMGTNRTIGHIAFGDTDPNGTPGIWTLYDAANTDPNNPAPNVRTITLDGDGSTPSITVNKLGSLGAGLDDALIQDVSLAGSQGFNKEGVGILTLTGPATSITGAVNVNGGTLRLDSLTVPIVGATFDYVGGSQTISSFNLANDTTLVANMDDGVYNTVANVTVAAGATATIRTGGDNVYMNSVTGGGAGSGSTLNLEFGGTSSDTYTADGNWTGHDVVNITGLGGSTCFFRIRPNGGGFVDASFASSAVDLDNVNWVTRTNSYGNNIEIGALSGSSTAIVSGGNAGGGSPPRYIVGGLDQSTVFSGSLDGTGGMSFNKVGSGNLTLAGPVTGTGWNVGGSDPGRTGGVFRVSEGTVTITGSSSIPGGSGVDLTTVDVLSGAVLDVSGASGTFSTSDVQQVMGSGTIVGPYEHDEGVLRPADTAVADDDTDLTNVPDPTAGTINVSGNLILSGGEIVFDMDTTPLGSNDKIMVSGMTSVGGGGLVTPNFTSSSPASGLTYTLLESTGGFVDAPGGWTVSWPGRGAKPTVFTSGNFLQFTTTPVGAGASMNWSGGGDPNSADWDVETTQAWYNNDANSPDVFFQGDDVTFADTYNGGTPISTANVNLTAAVQPASVVVDASSNDYTISGTGNIGGTGTFVKRGTSALTMQIPNGFSGNATIEEGTVDIGGEGGALGSGTLTLGDGTALGGGTVLTTANEFTNSDLVVDSGDNTVQIDRGADSGNTFDFPTVSGTGNLTVTSTVDNQWVNIGDTTGFSGNLTLGPDGVTGTTMLMRLRGLNGADFTNAAVTLVNGVRLANRDGSSGAVVIEFGALTGDPNCNCGLEAFLGGGSSPETNWEIGSLGSNTEFAGTIIDADGAISSVTKVGSAELILSGANTYTGDTSVENGTLSITSPYLADGADVYLTTGAVFDLDFGSLATIDTIDELFIDGIPQATGTYGRIGSGADHPSSFFDGDGLLSVSTFSGIPGDFDGDMDVDGDDFLLWQRNPAVGNLSDWEDNYGTEALVAAQAAASSAVPEPTSGLLAAWGLAAAWFASRRRKTA